jgi:hypothetical protein
LHLQVNELQSKVSRFHGLTAANPERKTIASIVTDGCESLKWQVGPALRLGSVMVLLQAFLAVLLNFYSRAQLDL